MAKKNNPNQGSLFGQPLAAAESQATLFEPHEQDQVLSITKFWLERHKIYLKRYHLQKAKPWTFDPVLRNYRFCNIYRELDTVSKWIIDKIIVPYQNHPDLWFMLALARIVNWPDTLQRMMDEGSFPVDGWNADKAYDTFNAIKGEKKKLITGAYIVNSVFPKGANPPDNSKAYYIPYFGLNPLWKERKTLRPQFKTSQEEAVAALRGFGGWGPFMAYQVIVDLTYSKKWLADADDINTFTSPGPGTTRGMNRILSGGRKGGVVGDALNQPMIELRREMNRMAKSMVRPNWWTDSFETGFVPLSAANVSNCLCEYDKYCRVISGEGEPRSGYKG
jgi:hypothetical protein